jgi:hypothetical protein
MRKVCVIKMWFVFLYKTKSKSIKSNSNRIKFWKVNMQIIHKWFTFSLKKINLIVRLIYNRLACPPPTVSDISNFLQANQKSSYCRILFAEKIKFKTSVVITNFCCLWMLLSAHFHYQLPTHTRQGNFLDKEERLPCLIADISFSVTFIFSFMTSFTERRTWNRNKWKYQGFSPFNRRERVNQLRMLRWGTCTRNVHY